MRLFLFAARSVWPVWASLLAVGLSFGDERQPLVEIEVTPAATGRQLVRTSVPFRQGALQQGQPLLAISEGAETPVAVRPLGWHGEGEQRTVRQALVTFPYEFTTLKPVKFSLSIAKKNFAPTAEFDVLVTHDPPSGWKIEYAERAAFFAAPVWPDAVLSTSWRQEEVEQSAYFHWQRWKQTSGPWQRVVEFRWDCLGQFVAVAHLQRQDEQENWAPQFGWEITPMPPRGGETSTSPHVNEIDRGWKLHHPFSTGLQFEDLLSCPGFRLTYPAAPQKRRGAVFTRQLESGATAWRYLRAAPGDRVPMQPYAWRRSEFVLAPAEIPPPTPLLLSPHKVTIDWREWDANYHTGPPLQIDGQPLLSKALAYHRQAVLDAALAGHDWGNVTAHVAGVPHSAVFGMNRLNHAPAIFLEAMRTGDPSLKETALAWCNNFHDLSIWWGPELYGGTRYNNTRAGDNPVPDDDTSFMWRGNKSITFCTKGYDSFLLAYELSGDPRMLEALEAQVAYAAKDVHTSDGECRNIGDAADFVRLYEWTGQRRYLDESARLFRELRPLLSTDYLFDQGGKPIAAKLPFIDEDDRGTKFGYAKPYIIGYGLAGCPRLAEHLPEEPGVGRMVRAVADFLSESQDPLGGWRYPHPASSRVVLSQALEHAWQLVQACELLGAEDTYLDAIERVLRQRIWIFDATGEIGGMLVGWETSIGKIQHPKQIYDLYESPGDRDSSRDYREGQLSHGSTSPEGLVYFPEVLQFYLEHRPASRLLEPPPPDSPLGLVLQGLELDRIDP